MPVLHVAPSEETPAKSLGIARSTLCRWLKDVEGQGSDVRQPANKTPNGIARLVWEITKANPRWGRIRISVQLALLNVFLAASTVRNILQRPQPPGESSSGPKAQQGSEEQARRSIPAWYPNHVRSVDRTAVTRWGFWPTYVLLAIDHFSRRIVSVTPLEGPNADWMIESITESFEKHGSPRHIISDPEPVFRRAAFAGLLETYDVKHRFGAVGKHESIAVTERAIKTLKYEWLYRVPVVKGYDHLHQLCRSFEEWYNRWRPHMTLNGSCPNDIFAVKKPVNLPQHAKKILPKIERHVFSETRATAYRLAKAA